MKRTILLCALLAVLVPATVHAHVLQADSDIGAVLHIYPDDNPVSGRPVEYVVSFTDVSKRFSLTDCDCSVAYKLNGEPVATKNLAQSSELDSVNSFTFPEPGIYSIEISGQPKKVGNFQPFVLTFSKRVSSGDIEAQGMPLSLFVGIVGVVGLILLAAYASDLRATSNKSSK